MLITKHSYPGSFPVPLHLSLFSNPLLPQSGEGQRVEAESCKPPIHKITLDSGEKKTNSCFSKILPNVWVYFCTTHTWK